MSMKEYMDIIIGVLKNPYVIGTVIVMILVIEFAKYVASYKKKPPKVKTKKGAKKDNAAPTETPKSEGEEKEEESSDTTSAS